MSLATSILALVIAGLVLVKLLRKKKEIGSEAPGPTPWWFLGNLPYIGKFPDLLDAFKDLKEKFGTVVSFKLGVHNSILISGMKNFREVLVEKSHIFDARPNFKRYDILFGGDRHNSLAFADGSDNHHKHRAAIAFHTFAKNGQKTFENFEQATTDYIFEMMEELKSQSAVNNKMDIKRSIATTVASIFIKYFTNEEVNQEEELFQNMVDNFDLVFQEINQGSIGDVLPVLMPFINKSEYVELSKKIRQFTEKCCFEPILKQRTDEKALDENNNESKTRSQKDSNVINSLLDLVDQNDDISLEHVFFAFEDIIGGHSAVSNSMVRIIHHLAQHPKVQQKIRQEVKQYASGFPTVSDRLNYTEATVWEAFRFISSPIVPHVATQDTTINDIPIKKDTLIFFNNMDMNFCPDLWESPEQFLPERFISQERILKPDFFLPFSTGKRSCLGYKIAINLCKVIIANLCQNFEISLDSTTNYQMERGIIAVGRGKSFPFIFKPVSE